jgi:hypothetical protein
MSRLVGVILFQMHVCWLRGRELVISSHGRFKTKKRMANPSSVKRTGLTSVRWRLINKEGTTGNVFSASDRTGMVVGLLDCRRCGGIHSGFGSVMVTFRAISTVASVGLVDDDNDDDNSSCSDGSFTTAGKRPWATI